MALIKDRSMLAKMQAISRWLWKRRLMNKRDLDAALRDAAYMQANLESKQEYYDENNEHLTNENGELGQFTDDGTVIRKNMERLQEERDKLAAAMAESDKDYQDLLAENEKLQQQVEEAELRAKTNPNKTFKKTFKIQTEKTPATVGEETEMQKATRKRFEKLEKL
jgi:chromosome segregation ATPase